MLPCSLRLKFKIIFFPWTAYGLLGGLDSSPLPDPSPNPGEKGYICWRRGAMVSGVRRMNEVNARRARLVLGWVTVFGRRGGLYRLAMQPAN